MESEILLFPVTLLTSESMFLEEFAANEILIPKNVLIFIFKLQFKDFVWDIIKTFEDFLSFSKKIDSSSLAKPKFMKKKHFEVLSKEEKTLFLERYLRAITLERDFFREEFVRDFVDISFMSFKGVTYKYKEGVIKKQTGGRVGNEKKLCNCNKYFKRFQTRWMMVRDTGIFVSKDKNTDKMSEILMYDSKFCVVYGKKATKYHDGMVIVNAKRKLVVKAGSVVKMLEWKRAIEKALEISEYTENDKRFGSLFPIRGHNQVKLFADGEDYFRKVYQKLKTAKSQVFITDWWLSPELYLKRPAKKHPKSKLIDVLDRIANKGISVYVHVYKELASALTLNSKYTVEALQKKNDKIRAIRHPKRSIAGGEFMWSHHEKIVCIDQEIAFLGGLDLCYGRMDNCKHKLKDVGDKPYWNGLDYSNSRIQDFDNVQNWDRESPLDRKTTPRMPWHDLAVMVKGDVAYDVSVHYIELWNHVMTDFSGGYLKNKDLLTPLRPNGEAFIASQKQNKKQVSSSVIRKGEDVNVSLLDSIDLGQGELELQHRITENRKSKRLTVQQSIDEEIKEIQYQITGSFVKSEQKGTCTCQIVRSAGLWSYGLESTDHSIRTAYLELINKAKYFIYIENQFFISGTGGKVVQNTIAQALVDKIIAKATRKEPFKVIVLMPLLPGFAGEVDSGGAGVLRIQLHWEYQTIIRGENSIYRQLIDAGIQDPHQFIQFYGLRTHDQFGENPVTEIVYIHSKAMIIDDDEMIIGSANINDRSMLGERDSEIAMVISDEKKVKTVIAGDKIRVSKCVRDFRLKIFKEYLGEVKDIDISDVHSEKFVKEWEGTAYNNTQKYKFVFGCYPDDEMVSYEVMKDIRNKANPKLYERLKKEFKGFLVEFPLHFLENEDLTFSTLSVENIIPEKSFI